MQIHARIEEIATASLAMEEALRKAKVSDEDRVNTLLTMEELLAQLIENAEKDNIISIRMVRSLYSRTIRMSCRGRQIDLQQMMNAEGLDFSDGQMPPEAEDYIREIILKSQSNRLNASYKRGINHVSLTVTKTKQAMIINIVIGILLGIVAGLLTRFVCGEEMLAQITRYCFSPCYNLFLKAINMVIAPLVFFSLANGIAGLNDIRSLGRVGGKVMGTYMVTTLLAILVSVVVSRLCQPGVFGCMAGVFGSNTNVPEESISLLNVIEDIVPDSFVAPFVTTNMLQVLFLAVCFGMVTATLGKYGQPITVFLNSMNELFNRLTAFIAKFLPVAVFGSMAMLVSSLKLSDIWMVFSWVMVVVFACCIMFLVYGVLLWIRGSNPFLFYRTFFAATLMAFSTGSSAATISTSMRCCQKMGLSQRIYSFSIPLGATINMDGTSIYFMTAVFFLANVCGVTVPANMIVTLIVSVMLISVAIPGVPGAGLACLAMLLNMVGAPSEAMMLVLAVDPLVDPFVTALNVTSDGAVTTMVSRSEAAVDNNK